MIYFTERDIDRFIEDDVPMGDMTSLMVDFSGLRGSIKLKARGTMIVSGSEEAERIYKKANLNVKYMVSSGTLLKEGEVIIEAEGNADAIHLIWRTGGAMLEFASGIATRTYGLVQTAKAVNSSISVAATRKHQPYLKKVALKAVMAGGGVPHRTGLSDTILVFKEHLIFKGGYENISAILTEVKTKQKERKVVVEAHTSEQGYLATKAGAHAIQFDKMPVDEFAKAVVKCKHINPEVSVLAAGGVNGKNAEDYAKAGADVLVTSWMYFGPPADIKAEITPVESL